MTRLFRSRHCFLSFFAFVSLAVLFYCSQTTLAATAAPATTATAAPLPQAIGQVVWVKGSVQAIQPGHSGRALKRRDVIFAQDTIITDASGTGEIVFTDSSVVALRSGTELKIDQYKYNPNTPDDNKYIASLAKGGFRTITGLISKGHPENYQVNTPVATIGVRGTIWWAYTNGSNLSLGILKGAIVATNTSGAYELNRLKTLPFAEISGIGKPAVPTNTQPAGLAGTPQLTPAAAPNAKTLQQQANSQQNANVKSTSTFGGVHGSGGPTSGNSSSGGTSSGSSSSSGGTTSTTSGTATNSNSGSSDTSVGSTDTGAQVSSADINGGSTSSTTSTTAAPSAPKAGGTVCIGK